MEGLVFRQRLSLLRVAGVPTGPALRAISPRTVLCTVCAGRAWHEGIGFIGCAMCYVNTTRIANDHAQTPSTAVHFFLSFSVITLQQHVISPIPPRHYGQFLHFTTLLDQQHQRSPPKTRPSSPISLVVTDSLGTWQKVGRLGKVHK